MREAATSGSYTATLAVLNVAEWLYLDRAIRAPATLPQNFIHGEWISLHDNPDFRDFVGSSPGTGPCSPGEADVSRFSGGPWHWNWPSSMQPMSRESENGCL
ncbi:hypothetical protein BG36_21620 [Aquamicrobium defluvii]|uniref:Uncharacterized protein n=1 Tax=Aquamicrobium defluvii TaxID=69279 RepID=A0A011UV16_9HYPH|nr:hypothetical protein BG36_21620 [Aquamicrobium defluvii]EZQ16476.1 hypothetical protein CF98_40090 [Halopseudomonas bauzanensis]TDR36809.1 hypothetical protein DES43_104135 [Aquamicrobium defluvii]